MQLMQFTVSGSRQGAKRCFVLLWNCVSRPFSLAFNADVGSRGGRWTRLGLNGGGFLAARPPQGLRFPALRRQHRPREKTPFQEPALHSAISPGLTEASHKAYKKQEKGTSKGKGSKPHDAHDI